MRFRLIEDHRDIWPVRVMCEALSVSPSGYYAWRSRPDSPRKIANRALLVDIRRVHAQHRERYGAPRIYAQLRAEGQTVSRKRVERVMRQHGLRARTPRRYRVCTTDSIPRGTAEQAYLQRDPARRIFAATTGCCHHG
jgi:putative transposase